MGALNAYGNTVVKIAKTSEAKLDALIAKVGFHKTKAKNLRAAARLILKDSNCTHTGDVKETPGFT
eukprot:5319248-Amphidinium_carterae.1